MQARIVEETQYISVTKNIKNIFNSGEFLRINKAKVSKIIYIIVYKKESPRFCVAFGVNDDNEAKCPFSAPFGYIEPLKKEQTVANFTDALQKIEECLCKIGIKKVTFFIPPNFYDKFSIDCWYNIMLNNQWKIDYVDLSFGLCLSNLINDYEQKIQYNAKKNLNIAMKSELSIREAINQEDKEIAYELIKINRESRGYPLRMTRNQVFSTVEIVPAKMFIASAEGKDIASAIIYDVTNETAQVIYWGDIPGYSEKKVINYLCYELIKIYFDRGFKYLDIGPSTENGLPNYGLCDFKDSIGCERTAKFKISKTL